jgi:hypothetical protein
MIVDAKAAGAKSRCRRAERSLRTRLPLEAKLFAYLLAIGLAVGLLVAGGESAAIGQSSLMQHALSRQEKAQLRDEIARMTSLAPHQIEVLSTVAFVRVVLVNTGYNGDPPSHREYLASTIAALITKKAETEPQMTSFVALHVEFVRKGRWFTKAIDTIEFRRGADGAFTRHLT